MAACEGRTCWTTQRQTSPSLPRFTSKHARNSERDERCRGPQQTETKGYNLWDQSEVRCYLEDGWVDGWMGGWRSPRASNTNRVDGMV